jgi:hypothetical protein
MTPSAKENPTCHQTRNLKGWYAQDEYSRADTGRKRPGIAKQHWDKGEETEGWNGECDKYGCEVSEFIEEKLSFPVSLPLFLCTQAVRSTRLNSAMFGGCCLPASVRPPLLEAVLLRAPCG